MTLTTRALIGASVVGFALLPALIGNASLGAIVLTVLAIGAGVASAAQVAGYGANKKQVYRPVYVRSNKVHQRVRSDG